jgi:hypothetical protein
MGDSFVVADIISRESGAENGPGVCNIVEHFARITYSCFQPHDPFVFIEREEEREREGERERERERERKRERAIVERTILFHHYLSEAV